MFYIVLLCLRYLWLFLFFSKQVLDCLITCKWRSYRFGTGKTQRYIPLHKLVCSLRPKHTSLPLIHAITGCDQVSFFAAKGKKTCWKTWGRMMNSIFHLMERFVVLFYNSTSTSSTSILEASKMCNELIRWGCKHDKGCQGRCKYIQAFLPCTALCNCEGDCER